MYDHWASEGIGVKDSDHGDRLEEELGLAGRVGRLSVEDQAEH